MIFSTLLLCVGFVSSLTIHLNTVTNTPVTYDVEVGSYLYVASTDMSVLLQNIIITDGTPYTAYTFSKLGVNSEGTMTAYVITTNKITIQGNQAYDYSMTTGYIYITTANQAKDPHFLVYPADVSSLISTNYKNATLVFLNYDIDIPRKYDYIPLKSARITKLSNSPFKIYWNEPTPNWNNGSDFFRQLVFMNPLQGMYYENIDPIQMNTYIWYIRAYDGITLSVEPTWIDPNTIISSGYNSSGMIMSTHNIQNISFALAKDSNYGGESGYRCIFKVESVTTISLGDPFPTIMSPTNLTDLNVRYIVRGAPSDYFSIQSASPSVGVFAIQYFQQQGDKMTTPLATSTSIPTTINGGTTQKTPATTTSSSSSTYFLLTFAGIFFYFVNNLNTHHEL
ncbi:unnamed protein product [Caenorhabditis angaria]|uniref:CUB-like domain-containing protein n=1 Tax=Caenorhabditis angaria TaxID=860376 RepID=A0A9P1N5Q7_9PELO|nr:unnamed protein product [Caenorhabditis angaria]